MSAALVSIASLALWPGRADKAPPVAFSHARGAKAPPPRLRRLLNLGWPLLLAALRSRPAGFVGFLQEREGTLSICWAAPDRLLALAEAEGARCAPLRQPQGGCLPVAIKAATGHLWTAQVELPPAAARELEASA
jgi:hypothetical protein